MTPRDPVARRYLTRGPFPAGALGPVTRALITRAPVTGVSAALVVAVVLLAACGGASSPREESGSEGGGRPPTSMAVSEFAGIVRSAVGDDRSAVRDRFGEPERLSKEPVENRHVPGQIDTVVTYGYDGLEVEFYAVTGGRDLLARTEIRSPLELEELPFEVGSPVEHVIAALGEPARRSGGDLVYEDPDSYAFLSVSVQDGVVRRIRLETPPD